MPDRFQFDVFLSHNAKDTPRVRRLAERLKQVGLQTEAGPRLWFDEWNVRSGDIIALKVDAFAHLAPIAAAEGQRPVNKPAQGNALGSASALMRALKGRHKTSH